MIKSYASLFLLVNVFIFKSNGDICISGGGNSNTKYYGNYVDMGLDSNGNTYYAEDTVCEEATNYLYSLYGAYWTTGPNLGAASLSVYSNCDKSSPVACSSWQGATSVSVSNTACPETVLTDKCSSITISGVNNDEIDGSYNAIAGKDGVYQKLDGSRYISYYATGRYYVGNKIGDIRCVSNTGTQLLRFQQDQVTGLVGGSAVSFSPEFPLGRTVSISCSANAAMATTSTTTTTTTTTTTARPSATGDLCFSTSSTGASVGSAPNSVLLSNSAGPYNSIGIINDYPAYKLSSTCDNSEQYVIMYVTTFSRYMMVRDQTNPTGTYFNYCGVGVSDVTQCQWASFNEKFTISNSGGSCVCGASR